MTELSITRAWSEATDFLGREFGLVFLIAFLLICLPSAALQYALPQEGTPIPNIAQLLREIGPFLLFWPVVIVLATIGAIAITHLAIVPGASAGEALAVGARRFIFLLIAGFLVGLGVVLCATPLLFLVWPGGGAEPGIGRILIAALIAMILALAVSVKLLLITPVTAAERGGPIELITRSWQLTRGYFWKLLGFIIVYWLAASVVLGVALLLLGLILGVPFDAPVEWNMRFFLMNLATSVLQALASIAFAITVARIYAQLTGAVDREIFA